MDKKQLYTALSRTTELNHVHLDTTKLNPKYKIRMPPHYVPVNRYFNDDYHNGQIYKITFEHNNKLYIGSSIRNLQERLNEHVTTKSSAIYQYKGDNPVITPIIHTNTSDIIVKNMGTVYSTNNQSLNRRSKLNTDIKRKSRQKINCATVCARNLVINSKSRMIP